MCSRQKKNLVTNVLSANLGIIQVLPMLLPVLFVQKDSLQADPLVVFVNHVFQEDIKANIRL